MKNENETFSLSSCDLYVGDFVEITDWMNDQKPLGIWGEVVDEHRVRIDGYSGTFTLSGGCKKVFSDVFPHRMSDRPTWNFHGPSFWVSPRHEGRTVSELSPRETRVRIRKNTSVTPVECGKGTHVFGQVNSR